MSLKNEDLNKLISPTRSCREAFRRPFNDRSSPEQLRQVNSKQYQERLRQKRDEIALKARGGLDEMSNTYLKLQHDQMMKEYGRLEEQSNIKVDYEQLLKELEEEEQCDVKVAVVKDESDVLDELLEAEQQELEFLLDQMSLHGKSDDSLDDDELIRELERIRNKE